MLSTHFLTQYHPDIRAVNEVSERRNTFQLAAICALLLMLEKKCTTLDASKKLEHFTRLLISASSRRETSGT